MCMFHTYGYISFKAPYGKEILAYKWHEESGRNKKRIAKFEIHTSVGTHLRYRLELDNMCIN